MTLQEQEQQQQVLLLQTYIQDKTWGDIVKYITTTLAAAGSCSNPGNHLRRHDSTNNVSSNTTTISAVLLGKLNNVASSSRSSSSSSSSSDKNASILVDNCFHLAILHRAPFYVMDKMIQAIGKQGLMTTLTPEDQWTALHLACWHYSGSSLLDKPIIQLLLDVGGTDLVKCQANKRKTTSHHTHSSDNHCCGCTALHVACANGAVPRDVIKMLWNAVEQGGGGRENVKNGHGQELVMMRDDENGYTALHHACITRQQYDDDVIQILLEMGGPNLALVKDFQGRTVLHHAVLRSGVGGDGGGGYSSSSTGYVHLIGRLLYLCGQCLVSQKDCNGWNALHLLCMQAEKGSGANEYVVLKSLLDVGGAQLILAKDGKDGLTALHMACARGGVLGSRWIQMMLLHCIKAEKEEERRQSRNNKSPPLVSKLWLLTKDKQGRTALDHAMSMLKNNSNNNKDNNKDKLEIVRLLLDAGGKDLVLERQHKMGQSILHKACAQGEDLDIIQLLLNVGGESLVLSKSKSGMTALFEACRHKKYCNVVKSLLDVGGQELVMIKHQKSGSTILHRVCMQKSNVDIVKLLLDVGGKDLVMVQDKCGCTALHKACKHHHNYTNVIQQLLDVGGQSLVLVQDDHGRTALHEIFAYGGGGGSLSVGIIRAMLDLGGQILAKISDKTGSTALHMACKYDASYESIALLLDMNCDNENDNEFITMRDKDGLTALHVLCQSNNGNNEPLKNILEKATLLKTKAIGNICDLIQMKTNQGKTAFQVLLENRYPELHDMWQLLTPSLSSSNDTNGNDITNISSSRTNQLNHFNHQTNVSQDPPTSLPSPLPLNHVNLAKVKREEDNDILAMSSSYHLLGNIQTQPTVQVDKTPNDKNMDDTNHDNGNDDNVDDNLQYLHSQLTTTFTKLEKSLKRKREEILELERTVQGKKARMNEMQNEITAPLMVTNKDKSDQTPPNKIDLAVQCCKVEHII